MRVRRGELSLLWKFYLADFIDYSFALTSLILIVYFSDYKGFSLGVGALVLFVVEIFGFLFEIPTGAFADIYGRKKSTLVYYFSVFIIFLLIPFSKNLLFLLVLFALFGIAITFRSGAKQAWIVEHLIKNKRKDLIQNYFTRKSIISAAGIIFAGLFLSGFFYFLPADLELKIFGLNLLSIDLIWIIEGVSALFIGGFLLFTKEDFLIKTKKPANYIKQSIDLVKKGFIYSFKHPVIFALLVSATLGTIFSGIVFISLQPFMINNGVPIEYFGVISSFVGFFAIFSPKISQIICTKFKKKNLYLAFLEGIRFFFTFIILLTSGIFSALFFLFIFKIFYSFENPISSAYFQEHAPSKQRATIGSIQNISYSFGGFIAFGLGAFVLNFISPKLFIFFGGFLIIPIIIIYLKIR